MNQSTPAMFNRIVDSVRLPLQHFLDTGFWDYSTKGELHKGMIGDTQVRSSCRDLAKNLKRPFIVCEKHMSYGEHSPSPSGGYKWVYYTEPKFREGFIEVPKKKYLHSHVAPLMLAAEKDTVVIDRSIQTLWQFHIRDEALWDQYYQYVLNDPDLRKARKLTS